MKKLIAICLLLVYVFNLMGYSLLFHYLIHQSEERFAARLSQNKYRDAELVKLSVPLNLPYVQNNTQFENTEGVVEIAGVLYNYVKKKIYNDTLYIMCLPNQQKNQLAKEKYNYAGEVNDFASAKKGKESSAKKAGPSTEYNNIISQYKLNLSSITAVQQNNAFAFFIPAVAIDTSEHPPQFTC